MSDTITITIPMDYPGDVISKNHMWRGGSRRYGLEKEAKRWKQNLSDAVQMALLAKHVINPQPPVHVEVGGTFIDRGSAPDLHNILELACDAVQDGTDISDRYFTTATQEPVFAKQMPEIRVTVTLTVGEL